MARPKVDPGLLTKGELSSYEARLHAARAAGVHWVHPALPAEQKLRLRRLKRGYWLAGSLSTAAGGLAGAAVAGEDAALIVASSVGFLALCAFPLAHYLQALLAVERWAHSYLDEIGYHDRLAPREPAGAGSQLAEPSSNRHRYPVTDGVYDPDLYRRRGGYRTKRTMEALGFSDHDAYKSNFSD